MVKNKNNNLVEYLTTEEPEDGEHSKTQAWGNKLRQDEEEQWRI